MKIVFGISRLALACLGLVTAAGLNVMVAEPAGATIIDTFALTSDHCGGTPGDCLTGPFGTSAGTVTVTDNGTGILQFSVVMNPGFGIISTGQGLESFGFNIDQSAITISNITSGGTSIFTAVNGIPSGPGQFSDNDNPNPLLMIDGFGSFDYALSCGASCGPGSTNPDSVLSFSVSAATPLSLTPQTNQPGGDVVQDTGGSQIPQPYFAADVCENCGPDKNPSLPTNTGPVDASLLSTPTALPEPASLALLGTALTGLGLVGSRRRRRSQNSADEVEERLASGLSEG